MVYRFHCCDFVTYCTFFRQVIEMIAIDDSKSAKKLFKLSYSDIVLMPIPQIPAVSNPDKSISRADSPADTLHCCNWSKQRFLKS